MVVALLTAAGCSSTTSDSSSTTAGPAALPTSTHGVSAKSITLGFVMPDLSKLPPGVSLPNQGDPAEQAKAFVDAINAKGGINGRTVDLKTYKFSLLDGLPAMRATCLQATEQDKVFAVLSPSFFADPILCLTSQHQTPLILAGGTTNEIIGKSNGLLYLTNFSTEHAIQASIDPLIAAHALQGKKLAVLLEDTPGFGTAIDNGLVKPLAAKGLPAPDKVTISSTQAGLNSLPAAVQRLKDEGVSGVFLAINVVFSSFFMQAAIKADYHPQYFASDLSENSSDLLTQLAPKGQLDGALGTTFRRTGAATIGEPADPFDEKCNQTYASESGQATPKWGSNEFYGVAQTCGLFDVFQRAATAAGKDLTTAAFAKALQGLTNFQVGYGGKGSFGPTKFDAPDEVRPLKYDGSCNCWEPSGPYVAVSF